MSSWTPQTWRKAARLLAILSTLTMVAGAGLALLADLSDPAIKNAVMGFGCFTIIAAAAGYCCVDLGRGSAGPSSNS